MKIFSLVLPLLIPLSASAEGYLVTPLEGGGIKAVSIQVSPEEWAIVNGLVYEQTVWQEGTATAIILEEGKPPRMSYASLEGLDRRFGGDGAVDLAGQTINLDGLGGIRTVDETTEVISLDDMPVDAPIELFDEDLPAYITLRDGPWNSSMEMQSQQGCPAQVGMMVEAMVGSGGGTQAQFSTPFHPTDFLEQMNMVEWKHVSTNGYLSDPFSPTGGADLPPGMAFSVQYAMKALSPIKVEVWVEVNLTLPAVMAAMAGGSTHCVAQASGFYDFAG